MNQEAKDTRKAPARRSATPPTAILTALLTTLLVATLPVAPVSAADDLTLEEVQAAIEANGWSWTASDDFVRETTPEQRAIMRGYVPPPDIDEIMRERTVWRPVEKQDLPSNFDWRDYDGLTGVRNQGSCGSCWAFAATAELESFIKIYYGVDVNLSEQQVVSCNRQGSSCNGGWAGAAYDLFQSTGAVRERCFPYVGMDPPEAPCVDGPLHKYGFVTDWNGVPTSINQIKTALLDGPVSVTIDASGEFDYYSGGCYDVPGGSTNHLVLLIGWDDRMCNENGAWIIKNSWGPGWGEAGYGYIQYGAASIATYVTQLVYVPPVSDVTVTGPLGDVEVLGDEAVDITWTTGGDAVGNVDIWFSLADGCYDTPLATNVPNTGSWTWQVPNESSESASILIFPSTGTETGFGFAPEELTIVGHVKRYVSLAGSDTPPYETPETAAHEIMDAVSLCAGRDSIMVAGGDYVATVTVSSSLQIFGGWSTDFAVRDPETYPTRIRGLDSGMRFFAGAGDVAGVDGFVFHDGTGGTYSSPVSGRHGGGIYIRNASPFISNCIFENNQAAPYPQTGYGGAITAVGGGVRITNCEFRGNVASRGGAISLHETVDAQLSSLVIRGNGLSDSTLTSFGAAIYVADGAARLTDVVIESNGGCGKGGGLALENAVVSVEGGTLVANRAHQDGGGVHAVNSTLQITGTPIADNLARTGSGGGLLATDGNLELVNSRVTDNTAMVIGGGLYITGAMGGRVENNVLTGNAATSMAAGAMISVTGEFAVRNNVVADNAGQGLVVFGNAVGDYNDVYGNPGGDYGVGPAGPHDIAADPLFVEPESGDYGLGLHSPAIDRGDPDLACADPDGSAADIGLYGGPDAVPVAPGCVVGASGSDIGGGVFRISWSASDAPDCASYVVYRDTASVFVPAAEKVVATLAHPQTSHDDTPPFDCYYVVAAVDTDGHCGGFSAQVATDTSTPVPGRELPQVLAVTEVVPNPFNPRTTIAYAVPRAGRIMVRIYDLRGRLVRRLVEDHAEPGHHTAVWDGRGDSGRMAAAGVYLVRVADESSAVTRKVVLAK